MHNLYQEKKMFTVFSYIILACVIDCKIQQQRRKLYAIIDCKHDLYRNSPTKVLERR